MEEYVISDRVWVWIIPMKAPTIKESQIGIKIQEEKGCGLIRINNGLIFWIVNNINKDIQGIASTIPGSQEWKGAAPSLIIILVNRIMFICIKFKGRRILRRNKTEANVWVRKYLIADSLEDLLFIFKIKGIKANVFNSNPTHLNIKEGDARIIIILLITHNVNKIIEGFKNIGKKEKFLSMGHEPISLI